jgi:hypothetical protein
LVPREFLECPNHLSTVEQVAALCVFLEKRGQHI